MRCANTPDPELIEKKAIRLSITKAQLRKSNIVKDKVDIPEEK